MIGIKYNAAKSRFLTKDVIASMTKAERKNLNLFGALTRKIAKNSMKNLGKRARKAIAGLIEKLRSPAAKFNKAYRATIEAQIDAQRQKNSSAPGQPPRAIVGLIKKLMIYAVDLGRRSVVIGPTLANKPTGAPRTLEEGGSATILIRRAGRRQTKRVRIAKRPFMAPGFRKAKSNLNRIWKNSVKP